MRREICSEDNFDESNWVLNIRNKSEVVKKRAIHATGRGSP
jgi:hypothetical protein